jgi:hypothetical protein
VQHVCVLIAVWLVLLLLLLQVHYLLEPCSDYVQAAVQTVVDIHREDVPGDVLVFLTGGCVNAWRIAGQG